MAGFLTRNGDGARISGVNVAPARSPHIENRLRNRSRLSACLVSSWFISTPSACLFQHRTVFLFGIFNLTLCFFNAK